MRRPAFSIGSALALLWWTGAAGAASLSLPFSPDPLRTAGLSPEGCVLEPGAARGRLGPADLYREDNPSAYVDGGECHSGLLGFWGSVFAGELEADTGAPAEFVSEPFPGGLALAGPARIIVHYADEAGDAAAADAALLYLLTEVGADADERVIASGIAIGALAGDAASAAAGQAGSFNVGAWSLARGSRLRLRLSGSDPAMATGRLLFGGTSVADSHSDVPGIVRPAPDYSDAGITLALEQPESRSLGNALGAGGLGPSLLLLLLATGLSRRRR